MKRVMVLVIVGMLALCWSSTVLAVPKGKSLTFAGSSMGAVTFDGTLHNNAAEKGCRDCHNPDVFPKMKQGTVKITMAQIYAGKQCGICHDGGRAFAAKGHCAKCHKR
ncbi:c(7)-type cytochrome triheme domain-containing protein [Desulfuromonas acetoxidans]|uniref:Cytochrome c7-like domain-containing protein n=1 Tax=Desulfuromonas acetoxidans (strain DSM 684 / 11070) TaxID=281689 RepID=Q1K1V5_DESA6|nr:c(7)-type cytochrome triheme domain-containing protein [Desulfuromonas acetoxidans]EAT16684.1 conserved hypothetical protein [Desulfuromonas acetoxidans DSM 684]MBF0645818.1 cytochrome C [Desulfuromonas acetoxidans]NVD24794.1 cytochrome C [Desulfuromonas acetoxidans]NVE16839.1 cytochrome C [Desulfuromonas acetoxidans]